jgi:hypothetical protein
VSASKATNRVDGPPTPLSGGRFASLGTGIRQPPASDSLRIAFPAQGGRRWLVPRGRRWSLLVQQPILKPGALDQMSNGRRRLGDAERDTCFLGGSAGDQHGSQS